MNDAASPPSAHVLARITRAVRFALVSILLGVAYLNVRTAWSIAAFGVVYKDMLGQRPLPAMTAFVMQFRVSLVVISFTIPAVAVATLFMRDLARPFYVLGLAGLIAFAEIVVLYHALSAPFLQVVNAMSGNSAQ